MLSVGTLPEQLPPNLLAEELCPEALQTRYLHDLQSPDPEEPYDLAMKHLRMAGNDLELGLAPSVDDGRAADHFDDARILFEEVEQNPRTLCGQKVMAASQLAFLPLYEARRENREPQEVEIDATREDIADLLKDNLEAPVHHLPRTHLIEEDHNPCFRTTADMLIIASRLGTMLLGLRGGTILYPATLREGSILREPVSPLAQDVYEIRDGKKTMLRVGSVRPGHYRRTNPIDDSVLYIGFPGLVQNVADVLLQSNEMVRSYKNSRGDLPDKVIDLLIDETHGEVLDGASDELLYEVFQAVKIALWDHARQNAS